MCGRAVERSPQLVLRVSDAGHETACHGWLWRPNADYTDIDSEKNDLIALVKRLKRQLVKNQLDFFVGVQSLDPKLLANEGYIYTSNAFDDDLPYHDSSGLIVVP